MQCNKCGSPDQSTWSWGISRLHCKLNSRCLFQSIYNPAFRAKQFDCIYSLALSWVEWPHQTLSHSHITPSRKYCSVFSSVFVPVLPLTSVCTHIISLLRVNARKISGFVFPGVAPEGHHKAGLSIHHVHVWPEWSPRDCGSRVGD